MLADIVMVNQQLDRRSMKTTIGIVCHLEYQTTEERSCSVIALQNENLKLGCMSFGPERCIALIKLRALHKKKIRNSSKRMQCPKFILFITSAKEIEFSSACVGVSLCLCTR